MSSRARSITHFGDPDSGQTSQKPLDESDGIGSDLVSGRLAQESGDSHRTDVVHGCEVFAQKFERTQDFGTVSMRAELISDAFRAGTVVPKRVGDVVSVLSFPTSSKRDRLENDKRSGIANPDDAAREFALERRLFQANLGVQQERKIDSDGE